MTAIAKYLFLEEKLVSILLGLIAGGRGQITNLGEKNIQVYLIIIREWPKNTPPPFIIDNLGNFPPGAFYSTPPQLDKKE